jgi:IS5 family transposase
MSFLVYETRQRLQKNSLVTMSQMINWEGFRDRMGDLGRSGYGPGGYDPVKMFKALVLQAWHSLSDYELEDALRVRLDFMVITGLEKVPDSTTICRFRNLLIKRGLLEVLFKAMNQELERQGFKVKVSQGAILDATVIASACRPKKELEMIPTDREEEETSLDTKVEINHSKDPDATWLKKGNRSHFGYKGFMTTDLEDGFITHVHVTSAHVSEVKELANILPQTKIRGRLYADKGYASQANKDQLKVYGLKNGIMEKAKRNKPLSLWQKRFNRLISKVRYKVEQGFGTLKRRFGFARAAYRTKAKVQGQMVLKAMAFNLLKALNAGPKWPLTPEIRQN